MKKIFTFLFLFAIGQYTWAQKDTIPRYGSNQGQTYTSAGVTYVYYNYSTPPAPVAITPNASQTNVRVNNVNGTLDIELTNTSSRLGDQIVLCFNSDSVVHFIVGSGIDFTRYFPSGTFQCKYFCGIFFLVVNETGQRIFVNNDSPPLSGSESSSACNYSAGFGAGNANNGSSQNTNVGINAGHNQVPSSLSNTNIGCIAGTGTIGGDRNIYIGSSAGSAGNFSDVIAIGVGAEALASGQTIIGAVNGNVYFGGINGGGSLPTISLQGPNRTGTNVVGNNFIINSGGGTGIGTPGNLVFNTYDTSGISNTTPQVATEKMRIKGESGFVGIGTSSPISKLHVVGQPTFVTGNQGNGKVLTSDANGTGDWQTIPSTESGVYFPTSSNTTNIDSIITDTLNYMRIGSVVSVAGKITIKTTASGPTDFELDLPFLSSFTDSTDAGGSVIFVSTDADQNPASVLAQPSTLFVAVHYNSITTASLSAAIHFQFIIKF